MEQFYHYFLRKVLIFFSDEILHLRSHLPPSLVNRPRGEAAGGVQVAVHGQLWKYLFYRKIKKDFKASMSGKKWHIQNCQWGLKMFENFVKNVLTSGIPVIIVWRKLSYFIPENINESE